MKTVNFDPNGSKLWVDITMNGYYAIVYAYQLLDTNGYTPLTSPIKTGGNAKIKVDDYYEIANDLADPKEPVSSYDQRTVSVEFSVVQIRDDFGAKLRVSILQGADFNTATKLGYDEAVINTGAGGAKDVTIKIKLVKS